MWERNPAKEDTEIMWCDTVIKWEKWTFKINNARELVCF